MADVHAEWLETVRRWKLDPHEPATDEYWSPKLETISRDELREIQGEKLVKAVAYMFDHSGLSRRKCEELGLEPGDIRGIEDLAKLPIMTKDYMSEDLQANPPWGMYMAVDTDDWLRSGWQVYPDLWHHGSAASLFLHAVRPGDVSLDQRAGLVRHGHPRGPGRRHVLLRLRPPCSYVGTAHRARTHGGARSAGQRPGHQRARFRRRAVRSYRPAGYALVRSVPRQHDARSGPGPG